MIKSLLAFATLLSVATPAAAAPVIGGNIVVSHSGNVIATYLGQSAYYTDNLSLVGRNGVIFSNKVNKIGDMVNLGYFTAGTMLTFSLNVLNTKQTFYSGPASNNKDGVAHVAVNYMPTGTGLGFEDIRGGGDRDYNDLIAFVSNTGATAAPEPATWALMIVGFGAVGSAMRRRSAPAFA